MLYAGLLLLLAYGLRVFRLDGQSLWYDEGNSALMTGRGLPEIIAGAAGDIHPPLYYVLLSWWSHFGGTNEYGLRFLSVGLGLLLVAVVYALGKKLFGRAGGLAAALIAAISPFLVYYSQETRMYMLGAFLCAAAGFALLKALEDRRYWPAYGLAVAASLYTQYYAFGMILGLNVFFLLVLAHRGRGDWPGWLGANLGAAVLYVPWLPLLANQASLWPRVVETQSANADLGLWFASGAVLAGLGPVAPKDLSLAAGIASYLAPGMALLLLAGLVWPLLNRARGGRLASRAWLPGLVMASTAVLVSWGSLLVPFWRAPFQPKFLVFGLPWLYLWMGLGAACLVSATRCLAGRAFPDRQGAGRGLPGLVRTGFLALPAGLPLLAIGLAAATGLQWYYFDPRYSRDDYRGLARYVEAQARPGDAIILDAPGQSEIFGYYYRGQLPIYPLPSQRPMNETSAGVELEAVSGHSSRLWAVLWGQRESDPNGFIERWLDQRGFKTADRWYGGVRLALYSVAGVQENSIPVNVRFGDYARLSTASLRVAHSGEGGPLARVASGDVIPLTLQWEALAPTPQPYKVFVHLLGPNSTLWGQHDAEPAGGAQPSSSWRPGETIADNHGLPVPHGVPPGTYEIEVGLYNTQDGRRLPVFDAAGNLMGDRVVFQPINVSRPAIFPAKDALVIERPLDTRLGDISLLGYEFFKLGTEVGNRVFQGGDVAHLALFWQASGPVSPSNHPMTVSLLDSAGREVPSAAALAGQDYPTDRWDPGEMVRAQYKVPLNVPPGAYRLVVGLASDASGPLLPPTGADARTVNGKLLITDLEVR